MVEHIEAELRLGPHPLSDAEDAMKLLHDETKDKFSNRYAKAIINEELKKNFPEKLKTSQVAMIPQKIRSYHTIMELFFQFLHRGALVQLVN